MPLEAHSKAQSSEIFLSVKPQNLKRCKISSFGQSSSNCIFKRQRSRAFKRHTACQITAKESCSSHLFWGGPKPSCSDCLRAGIIENNTFFFFGPTLVTFHIPTRLIGFGAAPKKSCTSHHITPYADWSMTKQCFHYWEGCRVSGEVPADTCTRV